MDAGITIPIRSSSYGPADAQYWTIQLAVNIVIPKYSATSKAVLSSHSKTRFSGVCFLVIAAISTLVRL